MGKKKEGGFWSDFKKFISRGNVVDMAVGVVIGAAFGAIVTGLVKYIINPIVGLITGGVDLENVKTVLVAEVTDAEGVITQPEVALMWGLWIQTIIDFIIVALCIFSIVRLITKMRERMERQKKEEEKKKPQRLQKNRKQKMLLKLRQTLLRLQDRKSWKTACSVRKNCLNKFVKRSARNNAS